MGSIGEYKYPEHKIDKCVDIVERIHNKGISKQEILAEELGHESAESGAFSNKLTSLRRYGLITGRGDIVLSELAKKIAAPRPNSNEREVAIGNAVTNVDLLQDLYNKTDYERPDENFWYQVAEVADADRSEAKQKADSIESLYRAGINYAKQARSGTEAQEKSQDEYDGAGESADSSMESSVPDSVPDEADAILITPDANIQIRNQATYAAAKALFDSIGAEYE